MTTAIHLAGPSDLAKVTSLMARYHEEAGLPYDDAHRDAAVSPLLDGSPLGAVWLVGPARAPLGYVLLGFGWSTHHAGMTGHLQEIFIRPSVRRRGIGTEVIHAIAVSLREAGLNALEVRASDKDASHVRFCQRAGFREAAETLILTDPL